MNTKFQRRIYIEAQALARSQRTGVDYWVEGTISPLVKDNPDVEFIFFRFASDADRLRISGPNIREIVISKFPAKLFRLLHLLGVAPSVEWLIGEHDIQTILFPNFYAWPVRSRGARIYPFVADTAFIDVPESVEHSYFRKLLYKGVARSSRIATSIITCSEASKQSIQKHFSMQPERITVLYPGYTLPVAKPSVEPVIESDYILFVGTLEPRKNVAALIKAYVGLPATLRNAYQLILAGGKGWLDEEIQDLIKQYAEDGVVALGYVDDAQKYALFQKASVFAYPALYEGFGMPVIEAQAHGVAVLTTRTTSLPEAGGSAALYCDTDVKSIREGLHKLLADKALRQRLARQGKAHAAQFTWQRSVDALQSLLELG